MFSIIIEAFSFSAGDRSILKSGNFFAFMFVSSSIPIHSGRSVFEEEGLIEDFGSVLDIREKML